MTCGDKIASARKSKNLTQEQLAGLVGVTRQAVSRWESDLAYPETEKLIRIAELLELDLNYLLKNDVSENTVSAPLVPFSLKSLHFEYKSERMVGGLPLVHVNFGLGVYRAKGIIALGNIATGILAFGFLAVGIFAFGLLGLGLLALGTFAVGGFAAGAVALGLVAAGAIAVGLLSFGAIALGLGSVGAVAVGQYFAMGDMAWAQVAVGMTSANGTLFSAASGIPNTFLYDKAEVVGYIEQVVPPVFGWMKGIFFAIL